MLDHLTQGRVEIGTTAGTPQEMAQVGMSVSEARKRNAEAIEILDAALAEPVISHHGKYWNFDGLRLAPRPLQRQWPPKWVTVAARIRLVRPRAVAPRSAPVFIQTIESPRFSLPTARRPRVGNSTGPEELALRR
jgi:hypothetical protein